MTPREKAEWIVERGSCGGANFDCADCHLTCRGDYERSAIYADRWLKSNPKPESKYITAEFANPFPEWWEGKPVLCRVWNDNPNHYRDKYVVAVVPDALYPYGTVGIKDNKPMLGPWLIQYKHAEPIPKQQPQDATIAEALQVLKDNGYTVEIKKEVKG